MNKKTVIFDLDGTLADCEHRRHFIATKPKNWKAFFAGIPGDTPIKAIVNSCKLLKEDVHVTIVTARPKTCESDTLLWLAANDIEFNEIYFREANDFRDDAIVKSEILDTILAKGYEPELVYDDRPKVIRMWKSRGLTVIDCGKGIEF
jgi:FMN phosphatase YigB (HAD superfamily)